MSNIYYLMGKSSSGKDTIYKRIKELHPELKTVTIYTTRPIREGEKNGKEYYFVNEEKLQQLLDDGKVIELRTYDTVHGPWNYFTVDDGQFDQDTADYPKVGANVIASEILSEDERIFWRRKNSATLYRSGGRGTSDACTYQRENAERAEICGNVQTLPCRYRGFLGRESESGGNYRTV